MTEWTFDGGNDRGMEVTENEILGENNKIGFVEKLGKPWKFSRYKPFGSLEKPRKSFSMIVTEINGEETMCAIGG